MRQDDGRKLDHHTLEVLRLRAVDQVARGVPVAEVGAGLTAVGIHPKTIYTWLAKARAGGRQALLSQSAPGPRRKLSDTQLRELADLIITTDPRDHGFPVALWTREIVRQLIAARFGGPLTVASVGRTLHNLGFSAQRPLYRAEQADPAAVARWKEVEYPAIAAAAKAAGARGTSPRRRGGPGRSAAPARRRSRRSSGARRCTAGAAASRSRASRPARARRTPA